MAKALGEKIKHYRKIKRYSQEELAKKASLSKMSIRRYERGERQPGIEALKKIAIALDCQISDLDESIYIIPYQLTPERLERFQKEAIAQKLIQKYENGENITDDELQIIKECNDQAEEDRELLRPRLEESAKTLERLQNKYNQLNNVNQQKYIIETGGVDWKLNEIIQKARRKEELTQEEQQQFNTYFQTFNERWELAKERMNGHLKRLQAVLEQLNESGQEKADEQIDRLIDQLELLTKIPEYQKDPQTKTAAPECEPQDGETDTQ